MTIALPTVTYDNGVAQEICELVIGKKAGGTSYMVTGAPFGLFCKVGIPISLPNYYAGSDVPGQDRIWNGQTRVMLLRQ